jgi:hypothetical protein
MRFRRRRCGRGRSRTTEAPYTGTIPGVSASPRRAAGRVPSPFDFSFLDHCLSRLSLFVIGAENRVQLQSRSGLVVDALAQGSPSRFMPRGHNRAAGGVVGLVLRLTRLSLRVSKQCGAFPRPRHQPPVPVLPVQACSRLRRPVVLLLPHQPYGADDLVLSISSQRSRGLPRAVLPQQAPKVHAVWCTEACASHSTWRAPRDRGCIRKV